MPPFVRVDVWSLGPKNPIITYFAAAVAAMKKKPATDVTSWAYQAAIHGTNDAGSSPKWNECRHGSWYFVSWHRAYLYYFERIVRAQVVALGGPAKWALPYWNYDGGSGHNALPVPFRLPTLKDGTPNPLYVDGRSLTGTIGLPASVTSPAFALSRTSFMGSSEFGGGKTSPLNRFFSETGRLEQTPHNDIHNMVGGIMLDPNQAAEDPIFWLHHCNIDRLWWLWQKTHVNITDAAWSKQGFDFFDSTGAAATKTAGDVEDTITQLDYTYDKAPPPKKKKHVASVNWPAPWPKRGRRVSAVPGDTSSSEGPREMIGATSDGIQLVGGTVNVPVPIDERASRAVGAIIPEGSREHRAFLEIENVDAERNPGTVYGVYVNLPPKPTKTDLARHHVGNVSLFGIERARNPKRDEHPHALRFSMEITDLLNTLAANEKWKDGQKLDVTFRPITLEQEKAPGKKTAQAIETVAHPETPIRIGRISVQYK